jgi:hypothetical protein
MSQETRLQTNSPRDVAFSWESFRFPPPPVTGTSTSVLNMTTSGRSATAWKKLNGATLTTPADVRLEIQPIGRGATSALNGLQGRPGSPSPPARRSLS